MYDKETEAKLFEWSKTNHVPNIEREKRFDWCKNIISYPFDFCIEQYKLIVELDGGGHFFQVMNWRSFGETQKIDKYKMDCANKNGYSIIRISQLDVWNDKNDWENNLKNAIKKYDVPTNTMIGDIYKDHPIYFQ